VTLHADGSVSVADDAHGTDTRVDAARRVIKKPVMATKDLRFFDHPDAETLPGPAPVSTKRGQGHTEDQGLVRATGITTRACRRSRCAWGATGEIHRVTGIRNNG
jgi:hypothetical protein